MSTIADKKNARGKKQQKYESKKLENDKIMTE